MKQIKACYNQLIIRLLQENPKFIFPFSEEIIDEKTCSIENKLYLCR